MTATYTSANALTPSFTEQTWGSHPLHLQSKSRPSPSPVRTGGTPKIRDLPLNVLLTHKGNSWRHSPPYSVLQHPIHKGTCAIHFQPTVPQTEDTCPLRVLISPPQNLRFPCGFPEPGGKRQTEHRDCPAKSLPGHLQLLVRPAHQPLRQRRRVRRRRLRGRQRGPRRRGPQQRQAAEAQQEILARGWGSGGLGSRGAGGPGGPGAACFFPAW